MRGSNGSWRTRRNRYSLHSLRRFAAKRWLDSGLNIRQVQALLGHEDLGTTIRYLNYDLDEIQRAAVPRVSLDPGAIPQRSVGGCARRSISIARGEQPNKENECPIPAR